jgi:transposase
MDVIAECCAGLDVHQASIVVCVLCSQGGGRLRKTLKTFATTAAGLQQLATWLKSLGVTHVGMEATGVYWMPVFAVLEAAGGFDLTVANAQHIKAVPGRKTDVRDGEWTAQLVRHGLMRKSFVPPKPIRDLRDLTRYRRTLVETQASERRRLVKLLEMVDIKLASVLSDVLGVTGRAILRALIAGDQTPAEMARLAQGAVRRKLPQLIEALGGRLDHHHRRILSIQLARVEAAEADIAAIDEDIAVHLAPYDAEVGMLIEIPGIDRVTAASIIAEIGIDMTAFPTPQHLAAWAGVCPGNHQSGGKHKPSRARKGNTHLKTALCNAATGAARKRGSFFKAKYHSLKARRGGGRATLAIAHKLLVCVHNVLGNGTPYQDLGEDHAQQHNRERLAKAHIRKLNKLGYAVEIHPDETAKAA